MTLIELMVVVAITGILATLGTVSMVGIVEAERARNEAVRFATQVRRQRAEAMQQQMYTLVELSSTANGVRVTMSAKRIGAPNVSPCTLMEGGDADMVRTATYSSVKVGLSTTLDPAATRLCLDPYGKPMTSTLIASPAEFVVSNNEGEPKLNLTIDSTGALASSDQPVASGIAQTSFFPLDLMMAESAPVPPNVDDTPPELPVYEVAPGEYVDADGTPVSSGSLGGTDDPCLYDASYCDPCLIDPYGPTCPCGPADPYCLAEPVCDPLTTVCAVCDPLTTICP